MRKAATEPVGSNPLLGFSSGQPKVYFVFQSKFWAVFFIASSELWYARTMNSKDPVSRLILGAVSVILFLIFVFLMLLTDPSGFFRVFH